MVMVEIDKSTVKHVASLARIRLDAEQEEKFSRELNQILDYIHQLSSVDTENTEPLYNPSGVLNSYRPDSGAEPLVSPDKVNKNLIEQAPNTKDGFVKVKAVLKK